MPIIPFALPKPFTRSDIKTVIAHPANLRAARILALIDSGTVAEIAAVIAEGDCYDRVVSRSESKPRSAVTYTFLFDASFSYGTMAVKKSAEPGMVVMEMGGEHPVPADWQRRVDIFSFMAKEGFTAGVNNWRGELLNAVMDSAFYRAGDASALAFARAAIDSGRVDLAHWAKNNYVWVGSVTKLDVLRALKLPLPSPGLLDCAVLYVGCSPNSREKESDRAEVVRELLAAGAKFSDVKRFGWLVTGTSDGSGKHSLDYTRKHGLFDLLRKALPQELALS